MPKTNVICTQEKYSTLQATPSAATSADTIQELVSEIRSEFPFITRLRIRPRRQGRRFVLHMHIGTTIYLTAHGTTLPQIRRKAVQASRKHLYLHKDRYALACLPKGGAA